MWFLHLSKSAFSIHGKGTRLQPAAMLTDKQGKTLKGAGWGKGQKRWAQRAPIGTNLHSTSIFLGLSHCSLPLPWEWNPYSPQCSVAKFVWCWNAALPPLKCKLKLWCFIVTVHLLVKRGILPEFQQVFVTNGILTKADKVIHAPQAPDWVGPTPPRTSNLPKVPQVTQAKPTMETLLTALAKMTISSGNWCVSRASIAEKEHRPAVKWMKKGSSFCG